MLIACDKAPAGLYELAKSVTSQSYLSFSLEVLEISPFLPKNGMLDQIMFVPNLRLSTEIVARTAITVTYEQGFPKPSIDITTTSIEEIEENIASVAIGQSRRRGGRDWSDMEIEEAFLTGDDPTLRDLFIFAKAHSAGGKLGTPGPKQSAGFGYYVLGVRPDGSELKRQIFRCSIDYSRIVIFLNMTRDIAPPDIFEAFRQKLEAIFGASMKPDAKEPNVSITAVGEHLEDFKEVIVWLQSAVNPNSMT